MEQQINCESHVLWSETHLSESVAVSFSGCRDNYLLSPVVAVEVFQVFLDGLQPGQFSREVNGCNPRVAGVPVQLFFQSLVDLVQRAQEELKRRMRRRGGVTLACKKVGTKWHYGSYYGCKIHLAGRSYFVLLQGDFSLLEAQHQLCVFCPDVTLLRHLFDLLWEISAGKKKVLSMHPAVVSHNWHKIE